MTYFPKDDTLCDRINIFLQKICGILFENLLNSFSKSACFSEIFWKNKLGDELCTKILVARSSSRFAAKLRQIFSAVFPFFSDIDALLLKYSNFTPSDSCIDQFVSNAHFLYLLKTLENRKVCKIFKGFQGVEKGCIGTKWVS